MNLEKIKFNLRAQSILLSEDRVLGCPSVIGYEKKFRWSWLATQLNTFIVASDLGDRPISSGMLERNLEESFAYAQKHYSGWPRGLQSGIGVISILISSHVEEESVNYCQKLRSGKKWAGFTIPVAVNASKREVYFFDHYPMWGRIYYPHFKKLIQTTLNLIK